MAFISQIIHQHPDAGYWHQQYPWFSIGQLVDASNKKDTSGFPESAQRAAIFFNDIPRLHWLLYQQEVDATALQALLHPEVEAPALPLEPDTQAGAKETSSITPEMANTVGSPGLTKEIPVQNKLTPAETAVVPVAEKVSTIETVNKIAGPAELMPSFISVETPPASVIAVVTEPYEDNRPEPAVVNVHTWQQPISNDFDTPTIGSESEAVGPEEEEEEEPDLIPLPVSMLSESLAQAADSYKNSAVDEDTMVFKTAYQHTIDYFASQGIQLDGEPTGDDRFGRQLKTFTSWLRQMKRLPDAPIPETDPLVESQAAHSLEKGEVVTEPMADVLLKQGKTGQAIAVLEKLRLLHPQKSHYFAARIDQLKHT